MLDESGGIVGGPFDVVFDVGGNIGEWAELALAEWPEARIYSFEPVAELAEQNAVRAAGRWQVYTLGISDRRTVKQINICRNQHTASTMQVPGSARRRLYGIRDTFKQRAVSVAPLDDLLEYIDEWDRVLVKIDVEGHEGQVIAGGRKVLERADAVVCEVNVADGIYYGDTTPPDAVDAMLRYDCGLQLVGAVRATWAEGWLVQLDGVWVREPEERATFPSIAALFAVLPRPATPGFAGDSSAADAPPV